MKTTVLKAIQFSCLGERPIVDGCWVYQVLSEGFEILECLGLEDRRVSKTGADSLDPRQMKRKNASPTESKRSFLPSRKKKAKIVGH